ncbi:MAG TPA: ATP-binding protein [Terriglobales bacterium]|nr:ATP-binding protein [Terriglobales bacterium]
MVQISTRVRISGTFARLNSTHAKILVCSLGLLVMALDLSAPADLNIGIFYCFVVALCAWTRSFVFLWSAALLFVPANFAGLLVAPAPVTGPLSWVDWSNRSFSVGALLLVVAVTHLRMRDFRRLEDTMAARNKAEEALADSETRLRLAQLAGHVGGWEWNPVVHRYSWSEECYTILGLNPADNSFAEKWMSAVYPSDLTMLQDAITQCAKGGGFEVEYRYNHPNRALRWIYARGKALTQDSGESRIFGIFQDITERKQAQEILQQSQSVLESMVEQRTAQLRKLSSDLMHSQDEERRRIARELHDSFGQNLAALKIDLDMLSGTGPAGVSGQNHEALLSDCIEIVQNCILETRTLSHLLHPALLDEAGFFSAAQWYVEGFAKRSGIYAHLELPSDLPRLPPALELVLFRALQESLTNVHRYSASSRVDIQVQLDAEKISLQVRDYGRGIPADVIQMFQEKGTGVGVGLAAMRARLNEAGGTLAISSDAHGTTVHAAIPILTDKQTRARSANVA